MFKISNIQQITMLEAVILLDQELKTIVFSPSFLSNRISTIGATLPPY